MNRSAIILLVDDNPDDIELTVRAFRRNAHKSEIVAIRDGESALAYLFDTATRSPEEMPRLVLLDLKLPRVDGHDVLRSMRADPRTKCIPVVVLTSSNEESDITLSYELGANSFVRKPIDFDSFLETAEQLTRYWLELNLTKSSGDPS